MDFSALLQKTSKNQRKLAENYVIENCMLCLSHCFFVCFWRNHTFCMAILQITQIVLALFWPTWAAGCNFWDLLCFTREIAWGDHEVPASSTPPWVYTHSFSSLRVNEILQIKLHKTGHGISAHKSLLWWAQHRSHEFRHPKLLPQPEPQKGHN